MWLQHKKDDQSHDDCNLPFDRRTESKLRRKQASAKAAKRPHVSHQSNNEESLAGFPANFRKGLAHGADGFLEDDRDYQSFRQAVLTGQPDLMAMVPIPDVCDRRKWESPTAGFVFDLEGPDAQAITMPPAPTLGENPNELNAELAEVYAMANLRDAAFSSFASSPGVQTWVSCLNKFPWFGSAYARRPEERYSVHQIFGEDAGRLLGRGRGDVTVGNLFRGVTTGDTEGPFLSQFLLLGTPSRGADARSANSSQEWTEAAGKIAYGAHTIDQRVRVATQTDFMTSFSEWLTVQNGTGVGTNYEFAYNPEDYTSAGEGDPNEAEGPAYRFIYTLRDMATYVHFDQLYQAYLNACILMLERRVPTDPGFNRFNNGPNQQGFAQFGGPHVLSLVTEVATRALKAVRFQKFNIHNRTRPEALGGLMEQLNLGNTDSRLTPLQPTWNALKDNGVFQGLSNHLLPMAFPEGSPMHPSYGAGHATVAGACVTILKAFFDHTSVLTEAGTAYEADPASGGRTLRQVANSPALTIEGELNKLASNISIGRNMAGVHYFSDYIDSLRLGELVAIGILEEQALMYNSQQFPFSMTVPLFDGGTVEIGTIS